MTAVSLPLRFQVGARTLASIRRRLVRVPLSLDEALSGRVPVLPPLERGADGYVVTSLPSELRESVVRPGMIAVVRQSYSRYFTNLSIGFDAWQQTLSSSARSTLKRKARKLAEVSGGAIDVRAYRTAEELAAFHPIARAISVLTYQERLMGSGLPEDAGFLRGRVARAWLLFVAGAPVAYLCCGAEGDTLRYDHVGHDPAFSELSPGQVLQVEAFRDLFAEARFSRFDFTEGEGQHKRQFSTGSVACVDVLVLRATAVNRAVTLALGGFDRAMAWAKTVAARPGLQGLARRVRRA